MGSGYIHQHSLFQSTLGRQGHKITATIVIYDLHVSKRPSILCSYTNNTSSIISRFSLRYCQKKVLFSLSAKNIVGCSFRQPVNMLEAPLCLWFPVLYSGHVLQIVLYSLPARTGGDYAGCWQHVLATCTKTEKTFKVSRLGCRVWDWNATAEKAGKEKGRKEKEKRRERKRKQKKRRKGEVHRKSPLDQKLSFCLVDTFPRTNDP